MNEQLKTIKAEGAEWVRLTKDQAERIGLGYCWEDGLMVNVDAYYTGMTPDAIFFNAHPQGRHPACSFYEWGNSSFAPDDLVDVLVATQNKFVNNKVSYPERLSTENLGGRSLREAQASVTC